MSDSPSCSYVSLSGYNGRGKNSMGSPHVPPTNVTGVYVVPSYGMIGYDALSHGSAGPSCAGYFSITDAYGKGAENCNTQFVQRLANQ